MFYKIYVINSATTVFGILKQKSITEQKEYKQICSLIYPNNGILIIWEKTALLIKPDKSNDLIESEYSYLFIPNEFKQLNYLNLRKFAKASLSAKQNTTLSKYRNVIIFDQLFRRKPPFDLDSLQCFDLNNYQQICDIALNQIPTSIFKPLDSIVTSMTIYCCFDLNIKITHSSVIFSYYRRDFEFSNINFFLSNICSSISFAISYHFALSLIALFQNSLSNDFSFKIYISKHFNLIAFENQDYVYFIPPENIKIEN